MTTPHFQYIFTNRGRYRVSYVDPADWKLKLEKHVIFSWWRECIIIPAPRPPLQTHDLIPLARWDDANHLTLKWESGWRPRKNGRRTK